MKAVIVTGDRYAKSAVWWDVVAREICAIGWNDSLVMIQGGANGIDTIAKDIASEMQMVSSITVPAQWEKLGKAAGPYRNEAMRDILQILGGHGYDVSVLAFHDSIETSKGTKNMVGLATRAGIPVKVVKSS